MKMERINAPTRRGLVSMGCLLGLIVVLFGATSGVNAHDEEPRCGNNDTGETAILGCRNEVPHPTGIARSVGTGPALVVTNLAADVGGHALKAVGNDRGLHARGLTAVFASGGAFGVVGKSRNGVGVRAESPRGTALEVSGKAVYTDRSGKTSIGEGLSQIDVEKDQLSSVTLVTATLQGPPIPGLYVLSVRVQPTQDKFTIYLSKAVPAGKTATVGWFIAN